MAAVPVLKTARLVLRPFQDADVAAAHRIWGDAEVMRYSLSGPTVSLDDTRAHIARHRAHDSEHGFAFRAIVERASDDLIGVGGLLNMPEGWNAIEVGYRLRPDRWGHGFATEAALAWLEAGFGPLGLEEILGVVEPENAASVRVLEKAGLRFKGEGLYERIPVHTYGAQRESWRGADGKAG